VGGREKQAHEGRGELIEWWCYVQWGCHWEAGRELCGTFVKCDGVVFVVDDSVVSYNEISAKNSNVAVVQNIKSPNRFKLKQCNGRSACVRDESAVSVSKNAFLSWAAKFCDGKILF